MNRRLSEKAGTNSTKTLGIILESASIAIFCLVTETKGQTFREIPGFYSTSGYTAVTFFAVKCEAVFTTASTREIQLCARPASQPTCSPLRPANRVASPLRMREDLSERGLLGELLLREPSWEYWSKCD